MWSPRDGAAPAERFERLRQLGEGRFGVVYEALDHHTGRRIALKVLRTSAFEAHSDGEALFRFKRELRAMASVRHVNLVRGLSLHALGRRWALAMERVPGLDFVEHTRHRPEALPSLLAQLVRGVHALHRHGLVHRDLKPTNVRVTPQGRLVILDFGLVSTLSGEDLSASTLGGPVGTPRYMAPEQALAEPATPASDWYAVGLMLHEALCGELPFSELSAAQQVARRASTAPPAPNEAATGVRAELAALCTSLLEPEPSERPSGETLVRLLDALIPDDAATFVTARTPRTSGRFVGRARELRQLEHAWREVGEGRPSWFHLHGPPGVGKSTLVERFAAARASEGALVLRGRCYPGEALPLNAWDSLVDDLSRALRTLPEAIVEAVKPRAVDALLSLFPVLWRVPALARGSRPPTVRQCGGNASAGGQALLELIARLASHRAVLIWIDDLHWADADSLALLPELWGMAPPPALMWMNTSRTTAPALLAPIVRDRCLTPLSPSEVRELLGVDAGHVDLDAQLDAYGGHPLLLDQLRACWKPASTTAPPPPAEVIAQVIGGASPAGLRVLHTVAAAEAPLDLVVAGAAACANLADVETLLDAGLLRHAEHGTIDLFHDLARQTLRGMLDASELRETHHRLARALELRGGAGAERLARHFEAAGEVEIARAHRCDAASKALEAGAFQRAAVLYDELVAQGCLPAAQREHRAQALTHVGRCMEASALYLQLAEEMPEPHRLELSLRAAEAALRGGDYESVARILRPMAARLGLDLSCGTARVRLGLVWSRLRLALTEPKLREAPTDAGVRQVGRLRADTFELAARWLGTFDPLRASWVVTQQLDVALELGDPDRTARALQAQALHVARKGSTSRAEALLTYAARLGRDPQHHGDARERQHTHSREQVTRGLLALTRRDLFAGAEALERAEQALAEQGPMSREWLCEVRGFRALTLVLRGELESLDGLLTQWHSEGAEACGGPAILARSWLTLALGQPWKPPPPSGTTLLTQSALLTEVAAGQREHVELAHARAFDRYRRLELRLARSGLAHARWAVGLVHWSLGTAQLANAPNAHVPVERRLRQLRAAAPELEAFALLLEAQLLYFRAAPRAAAEPLARAIEHMHGAGLSLPAWLASLKLARLTPERAPCSQAQCEAWLRGRGVCEPEQLTRLLLPSLA